MEKSLNEECFQKIMGDNISGGASFGRKKVMMPMFRVISLIS